MSRAELVAEAKRTLGHARAGTAPQEPGLRRVPISKYTDEAQWQLEMDRIYRRIPLVLGFSCEMAEPYAYKAMDVMGVPVLLVRGSDGEVRSFINTCSHRGARLVEDGPGVTRRFTCPYHAWSYDSRGALAGIFERAAFGEVDTGCLGLTPLPVAERAGIIFGGITPGMAFDIEQFLCGYGDMLEDHELASCHLVGRQTLPGPNWKVAYDGYLDFYHLPVLHRRTFGADYPNKGCADAWGPHQRQMQPDRRILALDGTPEDEWPLDTLLAGVWTIFPNVSLASFRCVGKLYQVAQLFPGPTPGASTTVLSYLAAFEPDAAAQGEIDKQIEFLLNVVRDEDYYTGFGIQQAIAAGAKQEFIFGRNEGNNQRFHQWIDDLVACETPQDTAARFAGAGEFHHD